jgi:succinate dehydrogenase / fumarate reductase flavoprotein subunit
MEAWDVIIIGSGHSALRSAIAANQAGASTVVLSYEGAGSANNGDSCGIASSLSETSSRGHRDDTIRSGDFLCDQDIVSARTGRATHHLAELERWGVNFRRNAEGIPLTTKLPGHNKPRVSGCGDTTDAEIQQVLEEQCIKRGISRRGDILALSLVAENNRVCGLTVLDLGNGQLSAMQCKSLIIADSGFEGSWTAEGSGGWGMSLALSAGIQLRDLEFQSWTPFGIPDSEVSLPLGLLEEGAILQGPVTDIDAESTSPSQLATSMQAAGSGWSLDLSGVRSEAKIWFASTFANTENRLGLKAAEEPIPVEPRVNATLGGIPVDVDGRAMCGDWQNVFAGLYAAGDSACSGLHGAAGAAGNRLLDTIAGGAAAGTHAANYAGVSDYFGSENLVEKVDADEGRLNELLQSDDVDGHPRVGEIRSALARTMAANMSLNRTATSLEAAAADLEGLSQQASTLHLDQKGGLLMNQNLAENLQMQAMIGLAKASVAAALERQESRGTHLREDYSERDDEDFLKHSLVAFDGSVGWLPLRKSNQGSWLLSPE